jgi:ubiquitin-conjugating enzyme E2 J2
MEINKITLKRINGDMKAFQKENPKYFDVLPNENNVLEIYFLMFGLPSTPYENGQYIGKIVHSPEYPRKAPDYYMLTPNGRFDTNKKICLTNSSYHQSDWAPAAWNLITILEGFSSVFHSEIKEDKVGISHITNSSPEVLKEYAKNSIDWNINNIPSYYFAFPKIK